MFNIIQFLRNRHYRKQEMVGYWKKQDGVEAKVFRDPKGHYVMRMQGEKYDFPGYPRQTLLFGSLSVLKHNVKNLIFNDSWAKLEQKVPETEIIKELKGPVLTEIFTIGEQSKYDMVPYERMVPAVAEIWRAMTVVEEKTRNKKVAELKKVICYVLQEDDAYRFRFQWVCKFMNPRSWWRRLTGRDPMKDFEYALSMIEHAEVVDDMKGKMRLFKRIIELVLRDPGVRHCFELLMHEMDWKKVRLSKADKYFFRAKYFKVDYPEYKY